MNNRFWLGVILSIGLAGCSVTGGLRSPAADESDSLVWLEDIYGEAPLKWVKEQNQNSEGILKNDKSFKDVSKAARKILTATDRIPYPNLVNGKYRNFWQDEKHVRGIWRETTVSEYRKKSPKWDTILDIDALNKKEGQSFVFAGATCLAPDFNLCLVRLSDGGKDATIVREFDVAKREFVSGGFEIPAAKSYVDWINKDTLLVGTDWGAGSLTTSGYPRQVRVWKRGEPLAKAKLVFEAAEKDVWARASKNFRLESQHMFVNRGLSFFEEENYLLAPNLKLKKLPFPISASFTGDFKNHLLYSLREDLKVEGRVFVAGSVVSLPIAALEDEKPLLQLEVLFEPDGRSAFSGLSAAKDYLFLNILRNVRGEIYRVERNESARKWELVQVPFANDGTPTIRDTDPLSNEFLVSYESFLVPTVLYAGTGDDINKKLEVLKKLPHRFRASGAMMEQFEAVSKDGTKVPYFVVRAKNMKANGQNATLLYGYGGFEISLSPYYLGTIGKVWLEKGGVYVVANIRGGGEFGPKWHRAALKENRQRAYDDFAAVAEDLISRKITSPQKLGIMGGSNGGLLVGVAATQRPDLYNAVVCKAALLDMLRYHKLPPGASWMGEYGNPGVSAEAAYIAKYSPYQNVKSGVKYPKIFFYVSTADDRVQPGHARKMAARMAEVGADYLFYENTEGGHGGAADLEQRITATALDYTYLYQQLMRTP